MKSTNSDILVKILEIIRDLSNGSNLSDNEEDQAAVEFLEDELKLREIYYLDQLPIRGEKIVIGFANSLLENLRLFQSLQRLQFTDCIPFPKTIGSLGTHNGNSPNNTIQQSHISNGALVDSYLTGSGYASGTDQIISSENSIIDLGDLIFPSFIGFGLPVHMKCNRIGKMYDQFHVFRSSSHCSSFRHGQLHLPILSSIGLKWKGKPKLGYNIAHVKSYGDIAFTFVREFRQFTLSLDHTDLTSIPFQSDFLLKLRCLMDGDYFSQDDWMELFRIYGTHIVTSASGGGRIVVTVLENHLKNFLGVNDLSHPSKIKEIESLCCRILDLDNFPERSINTPPTTTITNDINSLPISSITLQGGDPMYRDMDLTTCRKPNEIQDLITKWSQSLQFYPKMFDTEIIIEPIANLLASHNLLEEAKKLDFATQKIYGKSFWRSNGRSGKRSWIWHSK